ncbi:MAG: glycosyltransferase family 39 protein [Chloroflexota bacterium]
MSRADRAALLLVLITIPFTWLIAEGVFERMPHLEDEMAFVWQAQVIAHGDLTIASPPHPKSFLVPFVIDYQGQRFAKYPLGWPVVLSLGERLGVPHLINPLLAALAIWLTYRLGKKLFGAKVGLLAALLTLSSPFFLMNSGTLLSHPFGLVLSLVFVLAWIDTCGASEHLPAWLPPLTAGSSLGLLVLTRPLTALGVALPFGIHGMYLLISRRDRVKPLRIITVGTLALGVGSLHFLWQYALTGDPWLNPYTLWWSYDKIGFGSGAGITTTGHSLYLGWVNTVFNLHMGLYDLYGWGPFSVCFLPFGLWAIRKNSPALLMTAVFPSLVFVYLFYWVGSWLFGPRYYYEGLYSLTLISAAGVVWVKGLFGSQGKAWTFLTTGQKVRSIAVCTWLALFVGVNLAVYLPLRLDGLYGLYGINRSRLQPFLTEEAQALVPALVIVHPDQWTEYGALLDLEDPYLTSPFIFAYTRGGKADAELASTYPERTTVHYYPQDPYVFIIYGK